MNCIHRAREAIAMARAIGAGEDQIDDLFVLKEEIARLETEMAQRCTTHDLTRLGVSRGTARKILRRTGADWPEDVGVEHQDFILSAMDKLSPASDRRQDIYKEAAAAAEVSSPWQTLQTTRALVREENARVCKDPLSAYGMRRFRMSAQDETGCVRITAQLPPADAAILQAMMDQAFGKGSALPDDPSTVSQRNADAFSAVLQWASSKRVSDTGHAALVISVTEDDEMDLFAKLATNTSVDLTLFEATMLAGDRITDYVVAHDHRGSAKKLVTASKHANFYQRIALLAEQLVCQQPSCNVPAGRCDAHHVLPWSRGGKTVIDNLTLLCRYHHRENDDSWFAEHIEKYDGQSYLVSAGAFSSNESPAARRAGGRRVRERMND